MAEKTRVLAVKLNVDMFEEVISTVAFTYNQKLRLENEKDEDFVARMLKAHLVAQYKDGVYAKKKQEANKSATEEIASKADLI